MWVARDRERGLLFGYCDLKVGEGEVTQGTGARAATELLSGGFKLIIHHLGGRKKEYKENIEKESW